MNNLTSIKVFKEILMFIQFTKNFVFIGFMPQIARVRQTSNICSFLAHKNSLKKRNELLSVNLCVLLYSTFRNIKQEY